MKRSMAMTQLALAVSAALLMQAETAQAAYVVVNADPLFGVTYPGQGWSAQGALYIADSCYNSIENEYGEGSFTLNLATNDVYGCNSFNENGRADVYLTNVKLNLYNGSPTSNTVFQTLAIDDYLAESFSESYGEGIPMARLLDIGFLDGQVVSFHTTLSDFYDTLTPLGSDLDSQIQLQFSKNYTPSTASVTGSLSAANGTASPADAGAPDCSQPNILGNGAVLCVYGQPDANSGFSLTASSIATSVSNGSVLSNDEYLPEPGSAPLVAAGLAATWWTRRRRRRNA